MIDCTNCKAPCCRHVFGPLDSGDGVCKYLDRDTNRCTIYDHRPEICDTDRVYERYFAGIMSREEYDRLNSESCERLRTIYYGSNN